MSYEQWVAHDMGGVAVDTQKRLTPRLGMLEKAHLLSGNHRS